MGPMFLKCMHIDCVYKQSLLIALADLMSDCACRMTNAAPCLSTAMANSMRLTNTPAVDVDG